MNKNTQQIVNAIADEILQLARTILDSPQIGLRDSALRKNVDVIVKQHGDSVIIETLFADYIHYLEEGRKPRQGKQPPIDALREWALSKGIPTDNSTLYLIAHAIWEHGQHGKPILATLEAEIDKRFEDEWYDQLFESITEELNNYFN